MDTGDPSEVSGGQSVFVRNLVGHSRHEIVVACSVSLGVPLGRKVNRLVGGVDVVALPLAHHLEAGRRPLLPERLRCLLGAMAFLGRSGEFDAVYVHSAELMLAALIYRRGRPVVFHVHGAANPLSVSRYPWARRGLPLKAYGWLWKRLIAQMDLVLSVDAAGCEAAASVSAADLRCEVVPPAYDESIFRVPVGLGRVRRRIVHVGRVEWGKRLDLLLRAVQVLESRDERWEVAIVGDGSERDTLIGLAENLKIRDACHFLGWMAREDLCRELVGSSVFVLPSANEGVTTAVIEALACGVPVITRPLSGLQGVVLPGVNGEFWDGESPESLAEAIESVENRYWSREKVALTVSALSCESVIGQVDCLLESASRV